MRRQKSNATKSQSKLKRSNHILSNPRKKKRIQALNTRKAKRSLEALDIQDDSTGDDSDEDVLSEDYSTNSRAIHTKAPKGIEDAYEDTGATLDQSDQQASWKHEHGSLDTSVAFVTLRLHHEASKHQFQQIVKNSEARTALQPNTNLQPDQPLLDTKPHHDFSSNDPRTFEQWLGSKFDNLNAQVQDLQQQTLERVQNLQKEIDSGRGNAAETTGNVSEEDDIPVRGVRKLTKSQWRVVDRMFPGSSRPQEQGGKSSSAHTVDASNLGMDGRLRNDSSKADTESLDNVTAPRTRSQCRKQGRSLRYSTKMTSGLNVICEQD